ncbi:MAG: thermonuclease family protein [Halobacteriota archaeon]|nr:thermonuclease family protein [Halobacteriota archaeon]
MRIDILGLITLLLIMGITMFSGCIEEEEGVLTETQQMTPSPTLTQDRSFATVIDVIDGDTVRLQNGDKVRLLGINTPEKGQPYYEEATDKLKELVEGREVLLEGDSEDKDKYERLLRYIYVEDTFVNLELVRGGYANVYIMSPNTKYSDELIEAEEGAKNAGKGLWQQSDDFSDCVGILYFHWNADENDCNNLNDEYVSFKNTCSESIDMTGWTVQDEANHVYTFPVFPLASDATVTLYTGSGPDTIEELYWGSSGYPCNAVWNNDGDKLYLRDFSGNLVLKYSYNGF